MSLHTGLDQIQAPEMPFFSIGGIVGRSLWIVLWNFIPFILMTIVLAIPLIVYVFGVAWFTSGLVLRFDVREIGAVIGQLLGVGATYAQFQGQGPTGLFLSAILWLLLVFTAFAPPAALAQRAFQSMLGRKASFGNCMTLTFAALPRLVLFAVLKGVTYGIVGWVLGHLFFTIAWPGLPFVPTFIIAALGIVAGTFLTVVWWVGIPVLMVEWSNPFVALYRSWMLTRGKRWQIVAIVVLLGILAAVIQFVLVRFMPSDTSSGADEIRAYALATLSGLFGVFFYFAGAVAAAVGYFHLVGEKEGILAVDRLMA